MVKHYIKIAFRNMQKQKMFATINIVGFAIGIAACLIIALYINNETSYDRSNPNKDRVFRIVGEAKQNGTVHRGVSFPAPMAKALLNDFPQVEKVGRIMPNKLFGGATNQVRRMDQQNDSYEEGFCFADTSILDILDIQMIYGERKHALSEPYSIVLSKSMADKYFPKQDPVGQSMVFNDNPNRLIKIGGVMQDFPEASHMQYRAFISLAGLNFWDGEQETWMASNYGIYLQLKPGVDVAGLEKRMTADVLDKYMVPAIKASGQGNAEESLKGARLYLQSLTDIHLHSYNIDEDDSKKGDARIVWLFAAIALFILTLACINFLNLSTARSANRAKEVGLRKVIGSSRGDLIKQFLGESILYSFFSFLIAVILVIAILPLFNKVAGVNLGLPVTAWWVIPLLILSAGIIGLLAGLYPAFYLSYFKPINTLKGDLSLGSKNSGLRSTLVVLQFTVCIVLLISTTVVYKQLQYILNSKIGFDKDQVVMLQGTNALRDHTTSFKNELLRLPGVKNVSVGDFLPVNGTKRNGNTFWEEGKQQENAGSPGQHWVVDENYIATYGIKLLQGRDFSKDMASDDQATIINKAMANKLGFTDPIGKKITNGGEHLTIIGMVDNFHFETMKQEVSPLCLVRGNSNSVISVKLHAADMKATLASMNKLWKNFLPYQTLRYDFLDQSYAAMYADVARIQYIFICFSILAILIACLGLYALAAFMAEQRSKEMSIRKVLGASVSNLFKLVTGNFIKYVLISLCIAIPVGWLLMTQWLRDYAYRTNIGWDVFAMAGIAVLLIALLTVCWQSLKTAMVNPAKTLRGGD